MIKRLLSIIILLIISDPQICFAQNFNFNEDNNQKKDFAKNNPQKKDPCLDTKFYHQVILNELNKGNFNVFTNLEKCFKNDRSLIMKAVAINPEIFIEADEELHNDYYFVKRLAKINPEVIGYSSFELRSNPNFMEEMTLIYRDALKFASWGLLDNKPFMTKMIDLDSQNYKYGSDRIRSIKEIAQNAIKDNGMMLKFANFSLKNDEDFVKEAIQSDSDSLQFASKRIRNDINFIKLAEDENSKIDQEKIKKFINKHYFIADSKKNLPDKIANQAKFHENKIIFNHQYLTKWQKKFQEIDPIFHNYKEEWNLVGVDNRNYQTNFKTDLQSFPKLVEKIVNFLKKHRIDDNTIDNIKTTFLWKISDKPLTFAINIYFIRDSSDNDLNDQYSNVTSLTLVVSDTSKPITATEEKQISVKNNLKNKNKVNLSKTNKNKQSLTKTIKNNVELANSAPSLDLKNPELEIDPENNPDNDDEFDDLPHQLTDEENQQDDDLNIDSKNKKDDDKNIKSSKKPKNKNDKSSQNLKPSDQKNDKKDLKSSQEIPNKNSSKKTPKILENPNAKWNLSVIEAIFDSEIKMSEIFPNGHKKYVLWDLFKTSKTDKNPLLIFLVEDEFTNYFEIYARQKNHKYKLIFDSKDKS
jgi:hypothetical protein